MIEIKHRHTGKRLLRLRLESLVSADLQGVDLRHADLGHQALTGANLSNANLADADLVKASLAGASLRGARLERARLDSSSLIGAVMTQATLANADLLHASLAEADLTGAVLTGVMLAGAELVDASLAGADLTGANLTKANLAGANLEGARLAGAVLKKARFDNRTRWPANFEPEQHGAIRVENAKPQTVYPEYRIRLVSTSPEDRAADRTIDAGGSKLGGLPDWMHSDETPCCPGCDEAMDFVGQIDSIGCVNQGQGLPDLGDYVFSDCGMIYVFFCPDCSEVQAVLQFH
jgi:uncharacterized protein YjbI with pentapeptide repeats